MSDKKVKVLFVVPSLKIRGAEKMMVNLANRMDPQKFSIYMVSLSNNNPLASQLWPDATQFIPLARLRRFDIRPALQMRRIIIENQITSIIAQDIFSFLYVWLALWNIRQKPKIYISIHNSKYNHLKDLLKNFSIARLLSGDELFLSVCDSQASYWSKTYRIPRERFYTIYNGVDTDLFCPEYIPEQRKNVRESLNIPENAFIILQVASLSPEKRHEDAFTALNRLMEDDAGKNIFLVLVGDGPEEYMQHLKEITIQLGISKNVLFCGAQDDVKKFYSAADLFTLTSSTEAFSVAALEAMAMGLPCVITDVGGAREMILEGTNGFLVEPKNPCSIAEGWRSVFNMKDVLDSRKIRSWTVDHFSLRTCVQQYEKLLIQ